MFVHLHARATMSSHQTRCHEEHATELTGCVISTIEAGRIGSGEAKRPASRANTSPSLLGTRGLLTNWLSTSQSGKVRRPFACDHDRLAADRPRYSTGVKSGDLRCGRQVHMIASAAWPVWRPGCDQPARPNQRYSTVCLMIVDERGSRPIVPALTLSWELAVSIKPISKSGRCLDEIFTRSSRVGGEIPNMRSNCNEIGPNGI